MSHSSVIHKPGHTFYTVRIELPGTVNMEEVKKEIIECINKKNQVVDFPTQKELFIHVGVDWVNKDGKFSTRLKKYLKQNEKELYKLLTPTDFSKVCKAVQPVSGKKIRLRFWYKPYSERWAYGKYGDSGSCFFDSRGAAPAVIEQSPRAMGLVAWDESKNVAIGRCWIVRDKGNENLFYLFNSYGEINSHGPHHWIRLLNTAFNEDFLWEQVHLKNMGYDDGLIYINASRGIVFYSSKTSFLNIKNKCDLYLDTRCPECDNPVITSTNVFKGKNKTLEVYCPSCSYDESKCSRCSHCGSLRPRLYAINDTHLCEDCEDLLAIPCPVTGKSVLKTKVKRCECCGLFVSQENVFKTKVISIHHKEKDLFLCSLCNNSYFISTESKGRDITGPLVPKIECAEFKQRIRKSYPILLKSVLEEARGKRKSFESYFASRIRNVKSLFLNDKCVNNDTEIEIVEKEEEITRKLWLGDVTKNPIDALLDNKFLLSDDFIVPPNENDFIPYHGVLLTNQNVQPLTPIESLLWENAVSI